jgi:hypothetical protein
MGAVNSGLGKGTEIALFGRWDVRLSVDDAGRGAEGIVDGGGIGKAFGHVVIQDDDVRSLGVAAGIFAADAPREVVFIPQGGGLWFKCLFHILCVRAGWPDVH